MKMQQTLNTTSKGQTCKPLKARGNVNKVAFSRLNISCRATKHVDCAQHQESESVSTSRRNATLGLAALAATLVVGEQPSQAAGFKKELKKRKLTPEDYTPNDDVGLPVYELEEGRGDTISQGDTVVVHYDCIYKGLDVQSSRAARLLGGNRTIAEPYEFVAGETVQGAMLKKINDGANGLFAGTPGPRPPQALSRSVLGMKRGGKRSVLVTDPALGYPKGLQEIPAGATFELKVEILDILSKKTA